MGALSFMARRFDVANNEYLDDTFKKYSFALCTYEPFPGPYHDTHTYAYNVTQSSILYGEPSDNNVFYGISDNMPSNTNEIRFCVTDKTDDDYFFFYRRAPENGGFIYHGHFHDYIFGSMGSLYGNYKRAILNSYNLTAETRTGTFFWHSTPYVIAGANSLGDALEDFKAILKLSPGPDSPDPYDGGGDTTPGGGDGDFDGSSDNINIPATPASSATDTGFITLFNPSPTDLKALATYMWSNPLFDLSAWKKIFADPMGAILGLSIVPVNIPTSGSSPVTVGNISTGINIPVVSEQYVTVDCGSINVKEYWGAYLDYEPYTKAELYLPYCGIHPIATDDIMGKTVNVVYHVDIMSGACCAYVKCGGSILYTFIGQCSSSIPITGDNWTNVINGVLSAAVSVGSMVASEGATAGREIPKLAANVINNSKPSIAKSGAMGGTGGMLAYQKPYLIITRPRQALPQNQNKFEGYPSFMTSTIGALAGYTEIESVHLEGINATESELKEIEELLKSGVIL